MQQASPDMTRAISPVWYYLAVAFVLAMFFVNLGSDGIYSAQEGATGILTRNMIRSGNFLEMDITGRSPYEKPIMHYWLTSIPGLAFGLEKDPYTVPVELILRLPSAFAAVLCILAVFLMARSMYGVKTALISTVVLSTMMTFNTLGRIAHIDMLMSCAYAWAMLFFYFGYYREEKVNLWIYGMYISLAVGMLLKGPLPAILMALVILALMIRYKNWTLPFKLHTITGIILFLILGCAWYLFETIRTEGAFFQEFIIEQNFQRFTGINSVYREGKFMSPFYYFGNGLSGMAPWSLVIIIAICVYWKRLIKLQMSRNGFLLAACFITAFIFFSCSFLKRRDYLLPAYPAMGILISLAITHFCEWRPKINKNWRIIVYVVAGLLSFLIALNEVGIFRWIAGLIQVQRINFISVGDGVGLEAFSRGFSNNIVLVVMCALLIVILLSLIIYFLEKRKTYSAFAVLASIIGAVTLLHHSVSSPMFEFPVKSLKTFAIEARKIIPEDAHVTFLNHFSTELIFFLDRDYDKSDNLNDKPEYVIIGRKYGELVINSPDYEKVHSAPDGHSHRVHLYRLKNSTPEQIQAEPEENISPD